MENTARVEIDLAAICRNFRMLSDAAAPGECAAVVKADAYGLGVAPVARALQNAGCRHFFVATPPEGAELRGLLPEPEIFVLEGLQGAGADEFLESRLTPVLNTRSELRQWGSAGPAAVHIDTGMNRLGLTADDIAALRLEADRLPELDVRYVLTHLACADEAEHELNQLQIECFHNLRSLWPDAATSIANSAGVLLGDSARSDLARPGIALYGCAPSVRDSGSIEPVVTVKAQILQLKDIQKATSIGYGASFVASGKMRVATVAIGYADGYMRSLSNCGIAIVSGVRVPVVGRVSMDMVCLDVTELPRDSVAVGDWATMMGGDMPIEELAATAGTIGYELLTALGHRVRRVYLNDHS